MEREFRNGRLISVSLSPYCFSSDFASEVGGLVKGVGLLDSEGMKRILYASGSVLTGDDMAHVVALYATALAQSGKADTVSVPVIKEGLVNSVEIVIGPASQLIVEDAGDEFDATFDDSPYLAEVRAKLESLNHPAQVQPRPAPDRPQPSLDDF